MHDATAIVTMLQIVPKVFMLNYGQASLISTVSYAGFLFTVNALGHGDCFPFIQTANGCPSDELSNYPSKYAEDLQKRVLDRIVFVGVNKRDWLIKQRNYKRRLTWVSGRLSLFGNKYHH